MRTTYQPRRSGDACPASIQRASGGARGHRTQAGASSVGKLRSAPSGPLNDCACPESGRGHFLFHAGTSPATGCVCAGICDFFCATGGHVDPRSQVLRAPENYARETVRNGRATARRLTLTREPGSTPGSRTFFGRSVVKGYPVRGGRGGDGLACFYNGVAVPSRREAAIGENRGSRAFLHRDALGPVLTIGKRSLLLPLAAGARRCGRG